MLSCYIETCIRLLPCRAGCWASQPLSPRCHLLPPPPYPSVTQLFWLHSLPTTRSLAHHPAPSPGEVLVWVGGRLWREAEALALPGRKKAVKPRASPHQRPAAPASPIRAIGGRGSSERGCQEGAPRAPETSLEDEGGSLAVDGRSEDPGQPQPSVGAGWAWVGSAWPQSGPRLPPAQSLGRCPQ